MFLDIIHKDKTMDNVQKLNICTNLSCIVAGLSFPSHACVNWNRELCLKNHVIET
jgi:hypothetical protein